MIAGVAAGHPATAEAGAEILAGGGTAADAAVAACLASCVAETVMTGLLGGGHAVYFDAESGETRALDCFVAVPSGDGAPMAELVVPFGEELVQYAVGASSCAVPGVAAGLDTLWRRYGRLPWERLVEPALRIARAGVPMPAAHAACLAMLAPVMTMREGSAIYSPGGSLIGEGDLLEQPGLVSALELVRDEGARTVYDGSDRGGAARARRGTRRRRDARRSPARTTACSSRIGARRRSPAGASSRATGSTRCAKALSAGSIRTVATARSCTRSGGGTGDGDRRT